MYAKHDWVNDGEELDSGPVEGEKLAELRRNRGKPKERGGWRRLIAIVISVIVILAIALGVGLGVGLRRNKSTSTNGGTVTATGPGGSSSSSATNQSFPLGEYSVITALAAVNTNCTSNTATWRCYPYAVYSSSDSTSEANALAQFNWVISNTSAEYATNTSSTTPAAGVPANLTISSTNNPFTISFTNLSMTYISTAGNASDARFTFSFEMSKSVIPSVSIASDNAATECFYNSTAFLGTMYLNVPHTYPSGSLADSTGVQGYASWPYAVEIAQSSPGGDNIPACYETMNGVPGARINTITPEASNTECMCDYRNFGF